MGSIGGSPGSSSVPAGGATSVKQDTGNASLASIDAKLTDNSQKTQIVDAAGDSADVVELGTQLVGGDAGLVTNTIIHGLTTAGGGSYVDVKVNPSGALTVEATQDTTWVVKTKSPLTASSPTSATVGLTSAQAIAANASRTGLVLLNTSANTISFGVGASAVLNSGITLFPGGSWQMDEYTFSTAAINAIASAASSNLSIQEFT